MDKFYTISEVADKLNISAKTLRRWEEAGRFTPPRTIGGQRRYSIEDLQILDAIKHGTIPQQSDLLSIQQTAALFGVTTQTITNWENQGKIHPFITAGKTYYSRTHLTDKIEELKQKTYEPPYITQRPNPIPTYNFDDYRQSSVQPTINDIKEELQQSAPIDVTAPVKKLTNFQNTKEPINTQSLTPKSESISKTIATSIITNLFITLALLFGYHQITNPTILKPSSVPNGEVQGSSTQSNPLDSLIKQILDSSGNFDTPGSISTTQSVSVGKSLTFAPSIAPNAVPGTIYFDAGTQSLKIYTGGKWHDFPSSNSLNKPESTDLQSGSSTLEKGKTSVVVSNESITPESLITVTFTSDYSPGKKYWITQKPNSFTVHTDYPAGQDSSFTYLILTPQSVDSIVEDEESIGPKPSPEPSLATDSEPTPEPTPSPSPESSPSPEDI